MNHHWLALLAIIGNHVNHQLSSTNHYCWLLFIININNQPSLTNHQYVPIMSQPSFYYWLMMNPDPNPCLLLPIITNHHFTHHLPPVTHQLSRHFTINKPLVTHQLTTNHHYCWLFLQSIILPIITNHHCWLLFIINQPSFYPSLNTLNTTNNNY